MTGKDFTTALGQEIRRLRLKAQLSQDGLATRAGIHRNSLVRYEGGYTIPSDVLYELCDSLAIRPTDLIRRVLHDAKIRSG